MSELEEVEGLDAFDDLDLAGAAADQRRAVAFSSPGAPGGVLASSAGSSAAGGPGSLSARAAAAEAQPALEDLEAEPTRVEREEDLGGAADAQAPETEVPRVLIIGGNNRGREFPLRLGDSCIGRGVDNDVILADIAVSRKHTLICFEGGQFVVRDLGSGNGTLLNGKRVTLHPLQDGDQLELGNTLLRFVCPVMSSQLAHLKTVVAPRAADSGPELSSSSDQRRQPTAIAAPVATLLQAGKGGLGRLLDTRTKRLAAFGGAALVVLFGVLGGAKALLKARQQRAAAAAVQSARSADEVAAEEFQEGTAQYRARNWEAARNHFLKVLALAPAFEQARRYADQATLEAAARDAMEQARNNLASQAFAQARLTLSRVASTSVYAGDARALKQKVDAEEVAQLLKEAAALRDSSPEAASERIRRAREISPESQAVRDLFSQITGAGAAARPASGWRSPAGGARPVAAGTSGGGEAPGAGRPPAGGSAPSQGQTVVRVSSGGAAGAREALAHYRKREWGPAFQAARAYAETLRGPRRKGAEALVEAMRQVGQSWIRAESAGGTQAIRHLEAALAADAEIERGFHRATLIEEIFQVARRSAVAALGRGDHVAAFIAVRAARKHGKDDPSLRRIDEALEKKAQELFTQGYMLRGSNAAQARKLWQQVLRLVPSGSATYQKAYTWLNNASPSYQDEDED